MTKPNEERQPLNLDELFGTARPVVVVWGGRRYEMCRPEALTPVEYSRWVKVQSTMAPLMTSAEELDEKGAAELEKAIHTALSLFCPELAEAGLPFVAQVKVLQFYTAEVFEKADGSPNSTGA